MHLIIEEFNLSTSNLLDLIKKSFSSLNELSYLFIFNKNILLKNSISFTIFFNKIIFYLN